MQTRRTTSSLIIFSLRAFQSPVDLKYPAVRPSVSSAASRTRFTVNSSMFPDLKIVATWSRSVFSRTWSEGMLDTSLSASDSESDIVNIVYFGGIVMSPNDD